jgi:hypothetical protein
VLGGLVLVVTLTAGYFLWFEPRRHQATPEQVAKDYFTAWNSGDLEVPDQAKPQLVKVFGKSAGHSHAWFIGYKGDLAFAAFVQEGASGPKIAASLAPSSSTPSKFRRLRLFRRCGGAWRISTDPALGVR